MYPLFVFLDNAPQFVITTIAGSGTYGSSGDNVTATTAQFKSVGGVAVDISGNVYISDTYNCAIRFLNKRTGILKTIAGTISGSYSCGSGGDGFAATIANLYYPYGISLDSMNNLYISDSSNNKIRVMNSAGIITTFAGTGTSGSSGDGHLAINAQLYYPSDVAIGLNGHIYIADTYNNMIRMVNSTGIITTIAGTGTYGSDGDGGDAISATLSNPSGVAADLYGNTYIADTYNDKIRMVNSVGIITTFAGVGGYYSYMVGSSIGDGYLAVDAHLSYPSGVKVDSSGNVYIADSSNNVIRLVAHDTGIITTIAGVAGMSGMGSEFLGDNGPASSAYLYYPKSVALDVSGTLYIADTYDNRVRKLASTINYPTSQPSVQPSAPSVQPTIHHPTGQGTNWPMSMYSYSPYSSPSDNSPMSMSAWQPIQQVGLLFVVLLLFR